MLELFDLAFAHKLYSLIGDYDKSLNELIAKIPQKIDLNSQENALALLEWLNKWGCRNISKKSYERAIAQLKIWWKENNRKIYKVDKGEDENIIEIFDSLSNMIIEEGKRTVHFGPTATAKTLFIINQNAFVPWDDKIREGFSKDGKGYLEFIKYCRTIISDAKIECKKIGITWVKFKEVYIKHKITDFKIVDEYLWITKTKGIDGSKIGIQDMANLYRK